MSGRFSEEVPFEFTYEKYLSEILTETIVTQLKSSLMGKRKCLMDKV